MSNRKYGKSKTNTNAKSFRKNKPAKKKKLSPEVLSLRSLNKKQTQTNRLLKKITAQNSKNIELSRKAVRFFEKLLAQKANGIK